MSREAREEFVAWMRKEAPDFDLTCQFHGQMGDYAALDTEDCWLAFQAGRKSGLERAAQIAEQVAKEVGGNFADTHRLNVGLNKFLADLRRERERQ